jgi:hypothetical protein
MAHVQLSNTQTYASTNSYFHLVAMLSEYFRDITYLDQVSWEGRQGPRFGDGRAETDGAGAVCWKNF